MYLQSTFSKEGKSIRLFSVDTLERCAFLLEVEMKERWKFVPEYDGIYSVSNLGRVRRDLGGDRNTKAGRKLKPSFNQGYPHVCLCKNGKVQDFLVHTLVALAFVGEKPKGMEVFHKDNNPRNATLENLKYSTHKENQQYMVRCKRNKIPMLKGEKNGNAKLTDYEVCQIRKLYSTGKYTHQKLGIMFNVHSTNIGYIVNMKTRRI